MMISIYGDHSRDNRFVDLDGVPVKRTRYSHPYSYEPYVTYKGEYSKDDSAVYSDRLMQWDYSKFNKCCLNVFGNEGQHFSGRNTKDIEKFLCLYFDEQIEVTAIMQGCNVSNGYPYWIFFYRTIAR